MRRVKRGVAAGVGDFLTKFPEPSSGTVVYNGRDITAERPAGIARRGIVRLFQTMAVFPHLSVHDNVRVALPRPPHHSLQFRRSEHVLDGPNDHAVALLGSAGRLSNWTNSEDSCD